MVHNIQHRRSLTTGAVWQAAGLKPLVDYSKKKTAEKHLEELKVSLAELVAADPPLPVADLIAAVKAKKLEWQLPGEEVIKVR